MTAQEAGERPAPPTAAERQRASDRPFKIIALVAGSALVLFIILVVVRSPDHPARILGVATMHEQPPAALPDGSAAPGFTLPRLGGGQPVSLAAYRGRPVVLSFFASWCPDCRAELSAMAALAREDAGHLSVVGVDANDTDAAALRVLSAAGAAYPVGVDARARVAGAYLLTALPVTYFIDGRGRVVGAAFGSLNPTILGRWAHRLDPSLP